LGVIVRPTGVQQQAADTRHRGREKFKRRLTAPFRDRPLAVSIASGFDRDRGCYFLTSDALFRAACSLPWAPKLPVLFLPPDVALRLSALRGALREALREALPGEQRGALPNASGRLNGSGPLPAGH
jgi:hypothetical protein